MHIISYWIDQNEKFEWNNLLFPIDEQHISSHADVDSSLCYYILAETL